MGVRLFTPEITSITKLKNLSFSAVLESVLFILLVNHLSEDILRPLGFIKAK